MPAHLLSGRAVYEYIISVDTLEFDWWTAAGFPSVVANYVLRINAGVKVGGVALHGSPYGASISVSNFAAGSSLLIVNNGFVYGAGGEGAVGGAWNVTNGSGSAYLGWAGRDAILITGCSVSIDNTYGYIFGGGGGGTSGAGNGDAFYQVGGGGGGGGQGYEGGFAGAAGPNNCGQTASDGSPGSDSGPGAGGAGYPGGGLIPFSYGGDYGRDWGTGNAIRLASGGTVVWLGGYNSTQVKGLVA